MNPNGLFGCFVFISIQLGISNAAKEPVIYPNIRLNHSVDPCDDLYEHVCSRWVGDNPVPADKSAYSRFTVVAEKIKITMAELYNDTTPSNSAAINELKLYYNSCVDIEAIDKLGTGKFLEEIEKMGGWPILSDEERAPANLTSLLAHMLRERGYKPLVDILPWKDLRNNSHYLLNFDQRQLIMDSREYYLNAAYKSKLEAYRRYAVDIIWTFVGDFGSNRSREAVEADVASIVDFDVKLANISSAKEARYDFDRLYNLRKFSDLQKILPEINWTEYVVDTASDSHRKYFAADPNIVINELNYLHNLSSLLQKTDPKIVQNYVIWRYANAFVFALDSRLHTVEDRFRLVLTGRKKRQERWKDCLQQTTDNLPYLSGAVYVRSQFHEKDKKVASQMVEDLRQSFIDTLRRNKWVSKKTRDYALKKAKMLLPVVGYPDFLMNDAKLDAKHVGLNLTEEDDYATLEKKVLLFAWHENWPYLLKPPPRNDDMKTSAATVNAFNEPTANKILVPAAILQEPFFHRNYPKSAIYSAVGSILGHEMGHSFDGQGRQFDVTGNLFNWWDNKTLDRFSTRAKCVTEQYSKYTVREADGIPVNGALTRDENIADNVGLLESFTAYHRYLKKHGKTEAPWPGFEDYTHDQMFFLSFTNLLCTSITKNQAQFAALADPHSPVRFRINGVVSNMPQFAAAFKCSRTSPLNPRHKCTIW